MNKAIKYILTAMLAIVLTTATISAQSSDEKYADFYKSSDGTVWRLDLESVERKANTWFFLVFALNYPVGIGMSMELNCSTRLVRTHAVVATEVVNNTTKRQVGKSPWKKKDAISERLASLFCTKELMGDPSFNSFNM